jgi:hypothetical protein
LNLGIAVVFPSQAAKFSAPQACECGRREDRRSRLWQHREKGQNLIQGVCVSELWSLRVRRNCRVTNWVLSHEIALLFCELEDRTQTALDVLNRALAQVAGPCDCIEPLLNVMATVPSLLLQLPLV